MTFLFQVFNSVDFAQTYDHYRVLDLKKRVQKELLTCQEIDESMRQALEDSKKSGEQEIGEFVNFKDGSLMQIDMPKKGIDLEEYGVKGGNKKMEVNALRFVI